MEIIYSFHQDVTEPPNSGFQNASKEKKQTN